MGAASVCFLERTAMELLSVRELANRMKVSTRHVWSLLSSGRLPEPVRVGRSVRWRADDIDQWIRLGCPNREKFEGELVGGPKR